MNNEEINQLKNDLLFKMWDIMSPVCDLDIERELEEAIEKTFAQLLDNQPIV